jgi:uncharacterized repeat protein (TIGR03803 family)
VRLIYKSSKTIRFCKTNAVEGSLYFADANHSERTLYEESTFPIRPRLVSGRTPARRAGPFGRAAILACTSQILNLIVWHNNFRNNLFTQRQQPKRIVKTQTNKILPFALALTALALSLSVLQPVQAQTFTTNSPLLTARWGHAATLLPNGLVLIAGGRIANDYATSQWANTNNCELYSPATGSSTQTGPMSDSHFAGTATMLPNGQVLIVGGENNQQNFIASAELYDSSSGTWTNTGSLQQGRESFASALLSDGKVLAVGGWDGGEISSAEIYDPNAGTWTNAAPMNFAADSQTATLLPDGTVLVAGGSDNGNALTNALLYNPVNDTWTNTSPLNVARAGHVATLLPNGQVLVVGGGGNSAEIYDPNAGTWTLVASMIDGRSYPSATLLPDGQVLVLGGGPGQISAELYNPTNNSWTYTGPLNVGRVFHTATLVADGQVVVTGGDAGTIGYYNGPALADVETSNQAGQNTSLGFALNTTNLVWTTGGDANWFVESTNTHDNVAAAQSGVITDGQQSSLQTTVTGPGTLTFRWQVSSEAGYDFLEFDLDGNPQDEISGTGQGWAQETYSITSGTHSLQWLYSKDTSGGSDGVDGGFLDEVSYVATPTTGLIVTASPLTGPAPLTVQFTSPGVDSGGNSVTNWNWNFGDGATSSVQSPSHIYTNLGSFSPSLTAFSTFGALPLSVTGPGTITVTNHTLNVAASPQAGPVPLAVQFTSPSVDSGGNTVTNWNWNFGDGGMSTAQNPSHLYTGVGSFSPSLVARSTYGAWPLATSSLGVITVTNTPNPAFRTLYSFTPAFGSVPNGGLVLSGNTLYGTTWYGGSAGDGTVFAVNTDGAGFTNLYSFIGGSLASGVILSGSTLYGTTQYGGNRGGGGTVFAINTNGTGFTNVFNFNGAIDPNSGDEPYAGVVLSGNTLYGTTWYGGTYNHGTVFSVATNGANSGILQHFSTPYGPNYNLNGDGLFPSSRLISAGSTLFGTALSGGSSGHGTVFAVNTNNPGSFGILHYFTAPDPITGTNSDGAGPWAGLVLSGSILYGTTYAGGSSGNGTVFAVNTSGLGFTNLYSFTGGNGGSGPHAGLTLSGNTLYGTTSGGGTAGNGTLFALNTDGSGFTSLYSFSGGSDGGDPQSDLVLSGNTLYGTANTGGSSGNGTLFSFTLPSSILLTDLIKLPGGSFQFSFLHTSGSTNTVFATTNLALAFSNWTTLGTAIEVSSGHFQFTDPQATTNSKRFYRVRSP